MVMKIDFRSEEFQSIITKCIENNPAAWDRFFAIFTPRIKLYIIKKFLGLNQPHLAQDEDIVEDVFIQVVRVIYNPQRLRNLKNLLSIGQYIKKTTLNKVSDFIKARKTQKNLGSHLVESSMLSMDGNSKEGDDRELHEVVGAPNRDDDFDEILLHSETEIQNLNKLGKWVIILNAAFYSPLDSSQIIALSSELHTPEAAIRKKIEALMNDLCAKNAQREADFSASGMLESVIKVLENRLIEAENLKPLSDDERDRIKKDIGNKAERMHQLARKGSLAVTPTNKQLADILNIPEEKAPYVSTILLRARNRLRKKTVLKNQKTSCEADGR